MAVPMIAVVVGEQGPQRGWLNPLDPFTLSRYDFRRLTSAQWKVDYPYI